MGRKKDVIVWQQFEQMGCASICNHCKKEVKGKPSVSRLRKHLFGEKGGGISVCEKVPHEIKAALLNDPNKRLRTDPSSINNGRGNSTSTSSQHQHTHLGHEVHGGQGMQDVVQGVEEETGQLQMFEDMTGLGIDDHEPRGFTSSQQQNQHFEHVVHGAQGMQEAVQDQFQMFANMSGQDINHELVDLGTHSGVVGDHELRGVPLSQVELVGKEVADNIKKICSSLLIDEEVFRIGIYGMGGVGKTELAAHVHDKLLQDPKVHHVYWVEVTPNFSILSLQNDIAKAVNLNLLNENVERKRAGILRKSLMQTKPFVLFLDDAWSYIPLEEVGVPIGLNGCKLVLTTRSQDICQKMRCQEIIQVHCLDKELAEDWELFTKILSPERSLLPEVEEAAKSIVCHCGGLPLMIKCMARAMVGVDEIYEWRSALKAMKESKWSKDNRQVFQCLKRSYDHLQDPTLQQCFLYISLLGDLNNEVIIIRLIAEGIIDNGRSWQEKINEGHALLNKLQKVCLVTYYDYFLHNGLIEMHRLVRNMASQIMKEESVPSLVEVDKELEDLPDKRHWTNDLVRVLLAGNKFKKISYGHLPVCPNLSTLILCRNWNLHSIEDSFFSQLPGLKVLDLSSTAIQTLPESIDCLQNLTSLFLRRCEKLTEMPSLAMLGSLEVLDLSNCFSIRKVPQGLERLSNLKYLNLLKAKVKEFSDGILTNLTHLQFLSIDLGTTTSSTKIAEELACLSELETLSCRFTDFQEFEKYSLMSTKKKMELLKLYYLYVGPCGFLEEEIPIGQTVKFFDCDINGRVSLPHNVEVVKMENVFIEEGRGLCLQNAIGLKTFEITHCEGIEYLFSLSSSTAIFQSLQTVSIEYVDHLRLLFGFEEATTISCPPGTPFSNLRSLTILSCPRIKKLFPFALIGNLRNLETLQVAYCQEMEEIITAQELGDIREAKLPHLKHLKLIKLPNLKRVCSKQLECDSLHEITIINCEELKDVPISLPLPSLQTFIVWPEEWWASVNWGNPEQKNALIPRFSFLWRF